jgi:hypothetical protein
MDSGKGNDMMRLLNFRESVFQKYHVKSRFAVVCKQHVWEKLCAWNHDGERWLAPKLFKWETKSGVRSSWKITA